MCICQGLVCSHVSHGKVWYEIGMRSNTVTMPQHGINLRSGQFPHHTPRHNPKCTMHPSSHCHPCGTTTYPKPPWYTPVLVAPVVVQHTIDISARGKACAFSEEISNMSTLAYEESNQQCDGQAPHSNVAIMLSTSIEQQNTVELCASGQHEQGCT